MKRKLLWIGSILVLILLIVFGVLFLRGEKVSIDKNEVVKIEVFDTNDGSTYIVDNEGYDKIIDYLTGLRFFNDLEGEETDGNGKSLHIYLSSGEVLYFGSVGELFCYSSSKYDFKKHAYYSDSEYNDLIDDILENNIVSD